MLLQVPSRQEAYNRAEVVAEMWAAKGKAGLDTILPILPLIFLALPPDSVFATLQGREVTGAFLAAQGQAAVADGALDLGDLMRSIMAFFALPVRLVEQPLPPPPPPLGHPDAPTPVTGGQGLRPDGLPDKGQELWLEPPLLTDWQGDVQDVSRFLAGEPIAGPATAWFMSGMLDQPSWLPATNKGRPAPFPITWNWEVLGQVYTLASDATEGQKPRVPLFGRVHDPNARGIQMGDRWRRLDGWAVMVNILNPRGPDPVELACWTTRPDGTRSNVLRLLVAHA